MNQQPGVSAISGRFGVRVPGSSSISAGWHRRLPKRDDKTNKDGM